MEKERKRQRERKKKGGGRNRADPTSGLHAAVNRKTATYIN